MRLLNFEVIKQVEIDELCCTLSELVHLKSGATILHIGNDDSENLFSLSFNTQPSTSNGVAHILEHTVLCGSKKFPISDPFFEMTRRSLNTYMNALTGADFTCYPAASQVKKDFYNLLDVYIDAVFDPLLLKDSFLQEGHRLEFDENGQLTFQGVVFNEMKGAMATGEARLNEAIMEALFPDLTYGINSGGDPQEIVKLSYEELKEFHQTYYHPSRCLFFFYGNIPLEEHLDYLEKRILNSTQKMEKTPPIPKQRRFSEPKYVQSSYPIAENESPLEKNYFALGCLTCNILEQQELLALNVIDMALMGSDASPLKSALLRSGLCKQADSYVDSEMSEVPFVLVCKGCSADGGKQIAQLVEETLLEIIEKGLPEAAIEGAIHQLELSRSEIGSGHGPFGLTLFFRSALLKQHGGNPADGLYIHSLFDSLRKKMQDKNYLASLIEKHFVKNPHVVHLTLVPNKKKAFEEKELEKSALSAIEKKLSPEARAHIKEDSKRLIQMQEAPKKTEVLPKVCVKDISRVEREFDLHHEAGPLALYHHDCFTNDFVYADLVYKLPAIAQEDLPLVRLFSKLLPQIGCGGRGYADHLDYMMEHTGGIHVALDLNAQCGNPEQIQPTFSLHGKALGRNKDRLFPLMREMITTADFSDKKRVQELLMQHFHALESSIQHSSLKYAVNLAASGLSVPTTILNSWYGLDYFAAIKELNENFDSVIEKMQQLQEQLLGLEFPELVLSCDNRTFEQLKQERFYGLMELPQKPSRPWKSDYSVGAVQSQGRLIASPVGFTTQLLPSISYSHPDTPCLSIAAEIMTNRVLHKRIREQGGAYGSGAVNNVLLGYFYFYSYRDPNWQSTLTAFDESIQKVASGDFGDVEIEEAKLGIFQEVDSPVAPSNRADVTYYRQKGGRTPEMRQLYRERLLDATKEQIRCAVQSHLLPNMEREKTVTFAGKEFFEKEKCDLPLLSL